MWLWMGEMTHPNSCIFFGCFPSVEALFPVSDCADRTGGCQMDRGAWCHAGTLCPGPDRAHPYHLHWPYFGAEARNGHACTGGYSASSASKVVFQELRAPHISVICVQVLLPQRGTKQAFVSDDLVVQWERQTYKKYLQQIMMHEQNFIGALWEQLMWPVDAGKAWWWRWYLSWGRRVSRISWRLGKSCVSKDHCMCKEKRSCGRWYWSWGQLVKTLVYYAKNLASIPEGHIEGVHGLDIYVFQQGGGYISEG